MEDDRIDQMVKDLTEHLDLTNYDAVARSIIETDPTLAHRLVELAIRQLLG
jgi:hypothetical protein